MRISDWSSDVCSSDLAEVAQGEHEQDEADAIAEETDHACAAQHPGFGEMRTEQDRKPEVAATGHPALAHIDLPEVRAPDREGEVVADPPGWPGSGHRQRAPSETAGRPAPRQPGHGSGSRTRPRKTH